jgi:hypothetical protein
VRPYLEKKIGLVEWLKVKTRVQAPAPQEKKKKERIKRQN